MHLQFEYLNLSNKSIGKGMDEATDSNELFEQSGLSYDAWAYIYQRFLDIEAAFNFALVCRSFNQIHAYSLRKSFNKKILSYAIQALTDRKQIESSTKSAACLHTFPLEEGDYQRLLAGGEEGRYYSKSIFNRECLYITDFSKEAKDVFSCINMMEKIKEFISAKSINPPFKLHQYSFDIVSCHPIQKGVIITADQLVSCWHYSEEGSLELTAIHFPFQAKDPSKELWEIKIRNSTLYSGTLFLKIEDRKKKCFECQYNFIMIDLTKDLSIFEKLKCDNDFTEHFLLSSAQGLLIGQFDKNEMEFVEVEQADEGKKLTSQKRFLQSEGCCVGYPLGGRWIVQVKGDHIHILDSKNGEACVNSDMAVPIPTKGDDRVFITEDVLFVSYKNKTFRVIHLPTKKEYTDILKPFLASYLSRQQVFAVSIHYDKNQEFVLKALLINEAGLQLVNIPLSLKSPTFMHF